MTETVVVVGAPTVDRYGDVVDNGDYREIPGCVVGLRGQVEVDGPGTWDGDATVLEVLAPPGSVINQGDVVEVRGERYVVKHVPFDWSVGRRAAHPRHRPPVRFLVERGEA